MYSGMQSLKSGVLQLNRAQVPAELSRSCQESGFSASESIQLHLRFTSDTEYIVEAWCTGIPTLRQTISSGKLSNFVRKIPGASGYVSADMYKGAVAIEVFPALPNFVQSWFGIDAPWLSKQQALILEGRVISTTSAITTPEAWSITYDPGPETNCAGLGFACCDAMLGAGEGEQVSRVIDCPESCYQRCVSRPLVLSFTPDVYFSDPTNRVVSISPNTTVSFSVVADSLSTDFVTAVVDFGDGASQTLGSLEEKAVHTYTCPQFDCRYTATARVLTPNGIASADTPLTKLDVVVGGGSIPEWY
jgi:hypothetical protein